MGNDETEEEFQSEVGRLACLDLSVVEIPLHRTGKARPKLPYRKSVGHPSRYYTSVTGISVLRVCIGTRRQPRREGSKTADFSPPSSGQKRLLHSFVIPVSSVVTRFSFASFATPSRTLRLKAFLVAARPRQRPANCETQAPNAECCLTASPASPATSAPCSPGSARWLPRMPLRTSRRGTPARSPTPVRS
jgi:hypothetical protein